MKTWVNFYTHSLIWDGAVFSLRRDGLVDRLWFSAGQNVSVQLVSDEGKFREPVQALHALAAKMRPDAARPS